MNALPQNPAGQPQPLEAPNVDERNPWLGLASFTEETRAYFYGREDEVAELGRRVQRKLLTVLFGQSGLGKTSILRAGLVPRLRAQGYCPIYVRIDYAREAPEPAIQIKQAIAQTARRSGQWTQVGVAVEGESLWEFLHHRDDVLHDESGATLIPLLIFDQFEEIFTLAQSDDFGRARAARFIADLADLVENRPPKELEAKLEEDESAAERFDFARSDYRVLIALREDYLAPLEGLKAAMPSITQNRLRLAPMTGQQALAAVMRPGKRLVSEEVAAAIVRFVAGGAEIANAEVEPSLLSLICRELNDTRIAQGRSEISLDLLAGSHASILTSFYERSLADQPAAVRNIIEDELLTASGFRENVAEERLLSSFAAAGAAPDTLSVLVNRRLLRIEERLDIRRVELTHDVLCSVVRGSRDLRHEREARDATERLLAEQRERELAARRSLVRARQVAVVCTVLAIGALVAAVLAYLSNERAHRAEQQAEETRAAADQARGQAEHLLAYLADDFARELESSGRLDVVAELSKRQVDYFNALPPVLKGEETTRNGALALVHYAKAMRTLGHQDVAGPAAANAIQLLEGLRRDGDTSEATTIALALAMTVQARVYNNQQNPAALPTEARAVALLKPLADAPNASVAARGGYVEALVQLGFQQANSINLTRDSVATQQLAMHIAADLGGRDLKNIEMAAQYAEAGGWLTQALGNLGRNEEARRVGADASAVADKVLDVRPGYILALHAQQLLTSGLTGIALIDMRPTEAVELGKRSAATSLTLVKLDSKNTVSFNNMAVTYTQIGDAHWSTGHLRESFEDYRQSLEAIGHASKAGSSFMLNNTILPTVILATRQADLGDVTAASASLALATKEASDLRQSEPNSRVLPVFGQCLLKYGEATLALWRGDPTSARRVEREAVSSAQGITPHGPFEEFWKTACITFAGDEAGQAEYMLGDFAAAEKSMREALEMHKRWPTHNDFDRRDEARMATLLAMALAREGRAAEAENVITPVVKFHRELTARNHGDEWQHMEFASALYAQALADKRQRPALLKEAAALISAMPADMRDLHSVRLWRDRIRDELHARTAAAAGAATHRIAG
jgi:hypothetical protein